MSCKEAQPPTFRVTRSSRAVVEVEHLEVNFSTMTKVSAALGLQENGVNCQREQHQTCEQRAAEFVPTIKAERQRAEVRSRSREDDRLIY